MAATASAGPLPARCGPDSKTRVTRVSRQVPAPEGDPIAALDPELVAYFALAIPKGLDFSPNDRVTRRRSEAWFNAWLKRKNASSRALIAKYMAAAALVAPDRALEAYARIGQVVDDFSAALFVEPIPDAIRKAPNAEDRVEAFCDQMISAAEPLEQKMTNLYERCLDRATNAVVANEWSAWCELRVNQLAPDQYPMREELLGPPRAAPVITAEPVAK